MIKTLQLILNPKEGKKLAFDLIFSGFCLFAFAQDLKKKVCVWSLIVSYSESLKPLHCLDDFLCV